jgi:hypothetical protein
LRNTGSRLGRAKDTVRSSNEGEQLVQNLRNWLVPKGGLGIQLIGT